MSKNVLIANRGEIAIRIARTCKKLGLKPFGIYSDADINSLHIKHCEKSVDIGGFTPSESDLNMNKILEAANVLGCELIHPGYGFLSENPDFSMLWPPYSWQYLLSKSNSGRSFGPSGSWL